MARSRPSVSVSTIHFLHLRVGRALYRSAPPRPSCPDLSLFCSPVVSWLSCRSRGGGDTEPAAHSDRLSEPIDSLAPIDAPARSECEPRDSAAKSAKEANVQGNEESQEEEEWVSGMDVHRLLTHLPKSKDCEVCVRTKLYQSPHRRRKNESEGIRHARDKEEPSAPLERLACDHIVTRSEPGNRSECYTFVTIDRFSGMIGLYPCVSKESDEVESALRRFVGRNPKIASIASDRAPEIMSAIKRMGFCSEPAEPGSQIHNALAETTIRKVKGVTASLLLQSGFPATYWPLVQRYAEWSLAITTTSPGEETSVSCYEKAHGYPYEGYTVPFGALVWIRDPTHGPYDPKGEPALFLGPELAHGLKFKGLYIAWPWSSFQDNVLKERVVRSLAIPPGKWRFPAKIGKEGLTISSSLPGYLGGESEPAMGKLDLFREEIEKLDKEMGTGEGEVGLAPCAGDGTGHEGKHEAPDPKAKKESRNRCITKLRIAVHGPTKGCDACKDGTYSHTKVCRERFNSLLDFHEPVKETSAKESEALDVPEGYSEYTPSIASEGQEEDLRDDLEDASDVTGLIHVAEGQVVQETSQELERGKEAIAAILVEAIEAGENEDELSQLLNTIYRQATAFNPKVKNTHKTEWFVEFGCSSNSSCKPVAKQLHIPYLGLSMDFGNLLDPDVFQQVEFWFKERVNEGESVHLFGSMDDKMEGKGSKMELITKFHILSQEALLSGGSSSFAWPKKSKGWKEPEVLKLISDFNMFSSYPSGCGFGLTIKGRKPLRQSRIVTTSRRLASEMNRYKCKHPPGHHHDSTEEGGFSAASGNLKMGLAIISSLCSTSIMEHVPSLPCVKGVMKHEEKGLWLAQIVLALVHKPLSRDEIARNPKAKAALMSEATEMRILRVWDEETAVELDQLIKQAKASGTTIHVAEIMPICHIKGAELEESQQKLRGRLVFRGDECHDAYGEKAIYREVKSLPATVHSINIVIFYGLQQGHKVEIADATKAYLQAPLQSEVPTWVVLPRIIWHEEWKSRFHKVACRLDKALYGHATSGDDWYDYFSGILTKEMKGQKLEDFASLWYFPQTQVLVAAYVDDVIAAGPTAGVDAFWAEVKTHIKFDEVSEPGRYLGREHMIMDLGKGRSVFMSMADYAKSAYELYEVEFGVLKPQDTPYVSDSMLPIEGFEERGHLAGKAASLLMKLLWLARLSRPDLSFGITSLAGAISRWSRNHDVMIKRLLGYVKKTYQLGLWGVVSHEVRVPRLRLYCDSDLGGDPLTCRSHSGIFVVVEDAKGNLFPISWTAKRQTAVARSTTEAELASANEGVFNDGIPIKSLLEMLWQTHVATELMEDNSSCLLIIKTGFSPKLRSMNRTHRISVAALSEAVQANLISLVPTSSRDQLADIFTKALNKTTFVELRRRIGVGTPPDF